MKLFSSTPDAWMNIKDIHTWGFPIYVLTSRSQISKDKIWNSKSRLGIYLGVFPVHASNMSLAYNLNTKHVSPQFHVVFDDEFMSLKVKNPDSLERILNLYHDKSWVKLVDDRFIIDEYTWKPRRLQDLNKDKESLKRKVSIPEM